VCLFGIISLDTCLLAQNLAAIKSQEFTEFVTNYLANKTLAGLLLHPAGCGSWIRFWPSSLPSQFFRPAERDMRAAKKLYANLISKLFEA